MNIPDQNQSLLCRYQYDPLDRLVNLALPDTPQCQRFYCKNRLASEIQGALQHSIVQHGDLLLAQQQYQGEKLDTTLLATDQQRSVLHTLKAHDQAGPIAYSPYGHRPAESGLLSLLGFNGEQPNPVTGHYLLGNGYRAFNPVLMRFNSPDNLSPFGEGGLNSYAYCLGDPINLSDPQGHAPLTHLFKSFAHAANKSNLKSIQKAISKTPISPLPKARLKSKLQIKNKITENTKTLISESIILERAGIESGDIKPFTFPTNPTLSSERYFHHQKTGIPFNKSGVPNPKEPITTIDKSGKEVLRTDFFDDSIAFFHHQANKTGPEPYKAIMSESAGTTLLKRAEYIRKHALRNH